MGSPSESRDDLCLHEGCERQAVLPAVTVRLQDRGTRHGLVPDVEGVARDPLVHSRIGNAHVVGRFRHAVAMGVESDVSRAVVMMPP